MVYLVGQDTSFRSYALGKLQKRLALEPLSDPLAHGVKIREVNTIKTFIEKRLHAELQAKTNKTKVLCLNCL